MTGTLKNHPGILNFSSQLSQSPKSSRMTWPISTVSESKKFAHYLLKEFDILLWKEMFLTVLGFEPGSSFDCRSTVLTNWAIQALTSPSPGKTSLYRLTTFNILNKDGWILKLLSLVKKGFYLIPRLVSW